MEAILLALLVAVLNGAIAFIDQMLNDLIPMTLYADRYMVATSGGSMVTVLFDIMLGFGISMIVLKFLKRDLSAISCGLMEIQTWNRPDL